MAGLKEYVCNHTFANGNVCSLSGLLVNFLLNNELLFHYVLQEVYMEVEFNFSIKKTSPKAIENLIQVFIHLCALIRRAF